MKKKKGKGAGGAHITHMPNGIKGGGGLCSSVGSVSDYSRRAAHKKMSKGQS